VLLNQRGLTQAKRLAEQIAELPITSLYTSPLQRAKQTAEAVAEKLKLKPIVEPRLAESHRGHWEGLYWHQIASDDPVNYCAWQAAGDAFRFPGGESLIEHQRRVMAALSEIESHGDGKTLVICHGGTIRVALCARRGCSLAEFHRWEVPNGSLVRI
jgi:probable phosphoglycerate mutase